VLDVHDWCSLCLYCASSHVVLYFAHDISFHAQTWHYSNTCIHSYIIVSQPSENKPVEPTELVEPEPPGVEYVVEPEENQGKQLSMILCTHLIYLI